MQHHQIKTNVSIHTLVVSRWLLQIPMLSRIFPGRFPEPPLGSG